MTAWFPVDPRAAWIRGAEAGRLISMPWPLQFPVLTPLKVGPRKNNPMFYRGPKIRKLKKLVIVIRKS